MAQTISIGVHLVYDLPEPLDLLLQIEAADLADQRVRNPSLETSHVEHFARVASEEGLGERILIRADGRFRCDYTAEVDVDRPLLDLKQLRAVPPHLLPGDTVRYLMPSRYCPFDLFHSFVDSEFHTVQGGAKIAAMRDWIEEAFTYTPGSSTSETTAVETFVQRQGVCRDYAHVLVAMARASTIPARFASVYAPGVTPQDFHAVAEVFLEGTWHLVDATGMAPADTIARIGVGLDAAETSFLTSFGPVTLVEQSVSVSEL